MKTPAADWPYLLGHANDVALPLAQNQTEFGYIALRFLRPAAIATLAVTRYHGAGGMVDGGAAASLAG